MNRSEQGFTLVEVLVALLIFSIVAVGTITVIGVATAGGFLDTFPTSFATTRAARDYTAASTYLQAFHEFVANAGFTAAAAGTYCVDGPAPGTACTGGLPSGLSTAPLPSDPSVPTTSQLNWVKLDVIIEEWPWDTEADRYCVDGSTIDPEPCGDADDDSVAGDSVKIIQSTLTWIYRDPNDPTPPSLTVKRFLCSAANAVRSGSNPSASWCP